ncbi:MAG: (4Fe-4S)-binding protein [Bacteroidales bacterium]|nr:(4Fe-4S)-binding protein [Bacteroidales bacterium]
MNDPRNRQYTNGKITVFWIPSKCIHATTCFRELIEVFNPGRRPWVNMEGAPTRRIIEVVNKCPTQAITWKNNSDLTDVEKASQKHLEKEEITPETLTETAHRVKPTRVQLMKDGPIVVTGNFRIENSKGKIIENEEPVYLCRCGGSGNMPYCDGTHKRNGFSD